MENRYVFKEIKKVLSPEDIEAVTEGTGMAFSEVMTSLQSLSKNVAA